MSCRLSRSSGKGPIATNSNEIEYRFPKSDVPVYLFVRYLKLFMVLTWWMDHGNRRRPEQIDGVFRSLVQPTLQAVLA